MSFLNRLSVCMLCWMGFFVFQSAELLAMQPDSSHIDALLHKAVSDAQNQNQVIAARMVAIQTLRALAEHRTFSNSQAQTPIVSPEQSDLAMQTILGLLKDVNHEVVDEAAFQAWLALTFEKTSTQLSLTPGNRRKAELVVQHFPSLVLCDNASDSTRRRAVEKLSETADLLRAFYSYYKIHVQSELDGDKPNLDDSLSQIQHLIGELTRIRAHFEALPANFRRPSYAAVASNLLDALVADKDLRKAAVKGTASAATTGSSAAAAASTSASQTVDTSMQPIAASSLPSAIGMNTVSSDARAYAVSTRLLGVARTGSYSPNQRAPGARGDYPRTAGQPPKISQSRRSALRVPGETMKSTDDATRLARSRGASGADRATGAKPVAQPTQAKPATPASPATIPVSK